MGGRKSLNVNLHKTTDGGVGRWLGRGVGQCRCRATTLVPYIYIDRRYDISWVM